MTLPDRTAETGRILDGVTLKGTALKEYQVHLEEELSEEQRRRLDTDFLDADVASLMGGTILASSKIPIETQHRFLEGYARFWGDAAKAHLHAMGRTSARVGLSGWYKILLRFTSVEATLGIIANAWSMYFSEGVAKFVSKEPKHYTASIADKTQHLLHRDVVAGYLEQATLLAGAKTAHCEWRPGDEAHAAFYDLTWTR